MLYDVAVVGAGAAGCIAAGTAKKRGLTVALIERNTRPARKVMITGKGRCNLTNACDRDTFINNVPTNGRFLYGAFDIFSNDDVMALFESLGVPLKIERGNRVFPASDKSVDIVDALVRYTTGCDYFNARVKSVEKNNDVFLIYDENNNPVVTAQNIIIATGGASYPTTGSTGDGYDFARSFGHTVIDIKPSLVPIKTKKDCSGMSGLSLKNCRLTVRDKLSGKEVFSDFGEMLFTHFGVSGPLVLSASAHMRPMQSGRYVCEIDFKPALDDKTLDERIQKDFLKNINKDFTNSLSELLPRVAIQPIIEQSGIDSRTKVNQITKKQRLELVRTIKCFSLTVEDFMPISQAVVTSGGVSVKEIHPKTMESKICEGLYFAGEVIDVDAYTGGFNLQIAFCTGYAAGSAVT